MCCDDCCSDNCRVVFLLYHFIKERGKGLTSMPRQYKQIHFVLGKIYIYVYIFCIYIVHECYLGVVVGHCEAPRETEVCNFNRKVRSHEAVSGSNVSVNNTLGCHVLQPTGDLRIQYTLVHYTYILWDVMYSNPQATCVYNIH